MVPMRHALLPFLLLAGLLARPATAAPYYYFGHFTTHEGLPSNKQMILRANHAPPAMPRRIPRACVTADSPSTYSAVSLVVKPLILIMTRLRFLR